LLPLQLEAIRERGNRGGRRSREAVIVFKHMMADILNGQRTSVILPEPPVRDLQRVHRRKGPIVAHAMIRDRAEIDLDTVTDEDARRDGFTDAADYRDEWSRYYGAAWTGSIGCLVTFEVVPPKEQIRLLSSQQGARFTEGTDRAGQDGMYPTDHAGQYTSSSARALPREPEAVSPEDVSKFSMESRQKRAKSDAARVAWYRSLSLADQLRLIQQDDALADRHRGDLKVIARRIEAMWNKGKAA
jgi:hypothetical protein